MLETVLVVGGIDQRARAESDIVPGETVVPVGKVVLILAGIAIFPALFQGAYLVRELDFQAVSILPGASDTDVSVLFPGRQRLSVHFHREGLRPSGPMHREGEISPAAYLENRLAAAGIIRALADFHRIPFYGRLVGGFGDDIHIDAILPGIVQIDGDVFQGRHSAAPAAGPVSPGGELPVGAHVILPAQAVIGPGGQQGIIGGFFQFPGIFSVSGDAQHLPGEMHPFHHRAGFGTLIGGPLGRAVEQLPAEIDAAPGASQGGEMGTADVLPGLGAGFQKPRVPEQLKGLGHSREAAVHLINLPVADEGDVVPFPGQRNELEAGGVVQFKDTAVYEFFHHRLRPQEIEVAERIQDAAAGHAAVLPGLGYLDSLVEDGPMQKSGNTQGAVGITGLVQGNTSLGETFDKIGHDPGVPVHLHFLGAGAVIVAFVLPVAAQVAVFLLKGQQIIGHGNQFFPKYGISGALIGLCGGIHPLAGMFSLPAAFSLGHHLRAEQVDGITLRPRYILRKAAVVASVDSVAQKAADGYDEKEFHIPGLSYSNTAMTG